MMKIWESRVGILASLVTFPKGQHLPEVFLVYIYNYIVATQVEQLMLQAHSQVVEKGLWANWMAHTVKEEEKYVFM